MSKTPCFCPEKGKQHATWFKIRSRARLFSEGVWSLIAKGGLGVGAAGVTS
jgi:hypothetical protein